jgi:hypothetical protein
MAQISNCAIHALAAAFGMQKSTVLTIARGVGFQGQDGISMEAIVKTMDLLQVATNKMREQIYLPTPMRIHEFGYEHRDGVYVVCVYKHALSFVNGKLYDTLEGKNSDVYINFVWKITDDAKTDTTAE